jgi:hypothetical protein
MPLAAGYVGIMDEPDHSQTAQAMTSMIYQFLRNAPWLEQPDQFVN